MSDADIQRQIWEQRCPELLAERDRLKDQLAEAEKTIHALDDAVRRGDDKLAKAEEAWTSMHESWKEERRQKNMFLEERNEAVANGLRLAEENDELLVELNEATKSTGGWRKYVLHQKEQAEVEVERLRAALKLALAQHRYDTGWQLPGSWQMQAVDFLEGSTSEARS